MLVPNDGIETGVAYHRVPAGLAGSLIQANRLVYRGFQINCLRQLLQTPIAQSQRLPGTIYLLKTKNLGINHNNVFHTRTFPSHWVISRRIAGLAYDIFAGTGVLDAWTLSCGRIVEWEVAKFADHVSASIRYWLFFI